MGEKLPLRTSLELCPQLDKKALALVTGVKRFHEYVYGRHFDLVTLYIMHCI